MNLLKLESTKQFFILMRGLNDAVTIGEPILQPAEIDKFFSKSFIYKVNILKKKFISQAVFFDFLSIQEDLKVNLKLWEN